MSFKKEHIPWNKTESNSICRTCADIFHVSPSRITKGRGKYCSLICKYKGDIGRIAWNKGSKGTLKHTEEFKKNLSERMKKNNPMYDPEIKKKIEGANSPHWREGITSEDRVQRVKFQRTIQKKVFERDDYTCQLCGVVGVSLQVDHIQSWKDYVKLRFSIDNCRTLCTACHYQITFGKPIPKSVKTWGRNLSRKESV